MTDYASPTQPQPLWEGSRKPASKLTLQKTFIAKGDITKSSVESIDLSFSSSWIQYTEILQAEGQIEKKVSGNKITVEVSQDLDDKTYLASLPVTMIAGEPAIAISFLNYISHQYMGHNDLDGISLEIAVDLLSDEGIRLGSSDTLNAIFFLKNFFNPSYESPAILQQVSNDNDQKLATEFISRNAILINRYVFDELKTSFSDGDSPNHLLHIIGFLTDLSSGVPVLKKNLTDNDQSNIDAILHNMEVEDPVKSLDQVKNYFDRLYDFPVSTAAVPVQQVGGSFSITGADDVLLTGEDFTQYDLSLEYNALNADGQSEMVYLHYDWNDFKGKVTHNTINFSFSSNTLIVPAEDHEPLMVYVRAADGMELWSKEYKAGSAALRNIHITIARPGGNMTRPGDVAVANPKRLRGQILDMTGQKPVLAGAKVVIEAKAAGDTDWRIVGSALSDKDGYFSLPYPKGIYTAAQAFVSLMPDSPAAIPVNADKGDGRTISDDFIYLLLKAVTVPPPEKHDDDDCDCHNTLKATRLPDHADLIHADEYTQDLGAGCINLSTPNRTLKEYNHFAVVRTSDPDVANYTLERDSKGAFTLTGEKKKIRRKNIDLNNPIRWQDAPDTNAVLSNDPGASGDNSHSNLNFYQAVTISTGHILHYKSMFKADGYSLGELIYSLPLAPGQKKQIVVFDSQHNLEGSESQQLSVSERLAANITNDRDVADQLSGSIGESLRGRSSAETGGVAAAAAVAGSAGAVGGAVGVAGGYAMAGSNASQDSARDISQFFTEKLRNNVMQNADSYRQQNASVVQTVREGQTYSASTEVVANHNHCHSLTMMYFEVLRHYAIYQELSSVEECVFVPLLMTNFTKDNIFKWHDVLAANLLPIPSNTYLPSVDGMHPLAKGFDAIHRIKVDYVDIDFPEKEYNEETISYVKGQLWLRVNLPRPKTRFDRILSLPIVSKTVYHEELDLEATAKAAACSFGLSLLFGPSTKTVAETIQIKAQVFDEFMSMAGNWESVPPAYSMSIRSFQPRAVKVEHISGSIPPGSDFFGNDIIDEDLWTAYASLLGFTSVYDFMDEYFKNKLISDWDYIFYRDIAPVLYEKLVKTLNFVGGGKDDKGKIVVNGSSSLDGTFNPIGQYTGGERAMQININATTKSTRKNLGEYLVLYSTNDNVRKLHSPAILTLESLTMTYTTPHYNGTLYSGYVGEDMKDGAILYTPETLEDKRNPRKDDIYIAARLIEHLNSNLEHYNKVLWFNLDPDRRYMLLDGFNVQVFNDFGVPMGLKSLSSIIKNELITVAGNSLVFPVSPGFKIGRSYLVEKNTTGETERVSLLEHYKPLTPPAPYRISVPTKGLFMEAVKGQCDACEKVEPNTSQDWNVFKPDEPTTINAITAPTPTITDWKATFKDIATATVGMQTAPAAPTVGAGLEGLSAALTKSDTFKDVTGLAANQQNAASTYKSNMEAATKMAEIAKGLATQEHNTDKSAQIMDKLTAAKASGAITSDDYNKLVKQHLQQQIDGGDAAKAQVAADAKKAQSAKPTITDAAVGSIIKGTTSIKATVTDASGHTESVEIGNVTTPPAKDTTTTTPPKDGTTPPKDTTTGTTTPPKDKGLGSETGGALGGTTLPYGAEIVQHTGVPVIAQPTNMVCWAVATTVLKSWKAQSSLDPEAVLAEIDPKYVAMYKANASLPAVQVPAFLKAAGLMSEPINNPTVKQYINLLKTYGPLIIGVDADSIANTGNFSPHVIILTGVSGTGADDGSDTWFHFNDSGNKGYVGHLRFSDFLIYFEQLMSDLKKTSKPFLQIMHFADKLPATDTGNMSGGV
jgi:hypothetical protein